MTAASSSLNWVSIASKGDAVFLGHFDDPGHVGSVSASACRMVSTSRASDVYPAGIGMTGPDPMQSEFSEGRMRAPVRHTQD